MTKTKYLILALFALFAVSAAPAVAEPQPSGGLLINLTTDDPWAAAMAISFAHQRALKSGIEPVAIWLNVRGVALADKTKPVTVSGDTQTTTQDLLAAFIADGGLVYACPACTKVAGMTPEDYIDGVEMGTWETVGGLLFDPKVKTLSW